ncbi:SMC-Scp complex subunit ScpB [Candidatus Woesearchaeota archaeon]|jgi:segregation and condensation protein B|nr:SMC-Scp complex subunit ScpB [Candidatus Woesearchaeota archaeon]
MAITSKTADELDSEKEKEAVRLIEAVLFVSGRFLSMQDLISYSDLNPMVIRECLDKLKERYTKEDSVIEIVERTEMWKMDVKPEYSNVISRLATGKSEFTKAEQETLALIAYKQPIKQSVIIKIRGNKAYEHVSKFRSLNLVRAKKEGHTNILTLSEEFYDYFNVSSNSENPLKEEVDEQEGFGVVAESGLA